MEKLQKLAIILLMLLALLPAYYFNKWIQVQLKPRQSLGRLFLYFLASMLMVVVYTFLVVWLISVLFPLPNR